MIGFCPLASGSKGNAYLLSTPHCKVLVDAGISGRALKARLAFFDLKVDDIDAILVTHEHIDHIMGLKVLALKTQIPIFCNHETAKGILEVLGQGAQYKIFSSEEAFEFNDLYISPFSIPHDALDPVAFAIEVQSLGMRLGICTDLGFFHDGILQALKGCHCLVLEANHDPHMVHSSKRPDIYKQRVLSRVGHLSNEACRDLLKALIHDQLSQVYLAHLSAECNCHLKAMETVKEAISDGREIALHIAKQEENSTPLLFSAGLPTL